MFESQGVLIWAFGVSVQLVLSGDLEHMSSFQARNIEIANRTHRIGGGRRSSVAVAKSSVSAKLKQYPWAFILIGYDCPYQDQS